MVTVVIPVGPNHTHLLPHALASCDQPGITRVIVVNDSGAPLPISSLDGRRRGVAHARNMGIAAVKTPYLILLDADDMLMPAAAASLLSGMQGEPAAAYVYGDWWETDSRGVKVYKAARPQSDLMGGGIHPITCLLPTALAQSIPFESEVAGWEDWVYWLEVAAQGHQGKHIKTPIMIYRQHTGERREQSYAKGGGLIDSIRARFGPRLAKVDFMCRGCTGSNHPLPANTVAPLSAPAGGNVLLEYTGPQLGVAPRTLSNGRTIRFGALNPKEKIQEIAREDAEMAVEDCPSEFRIIQQPDPSAAEAAEAAATSAPAIPLDDSFFELSHEEQAARLAEAEGQPAPMLDAFNAAASEPAPDPAPRRGRKPKAPADASAEDDGDDEPITPPGALGPNDGYTRA